MYALEIDYHFKDYHGIGQEIIEEVPPQEHPLMNLQ